MEKYNIMTKGIMAKGFITFDLNDAITESELKNNKEEFFKRVDATVSYVNSTVKEDCYFVLRLPKRCIESFDSTEIIQYNYGEEDEILCVPNCSELVSLVALSDNTTEIQLFIVLSDGDNND